MENKIGLAWPVNIHGGWGGLGLNLATELHRTRAAEPVLLIPLPKLADPLLSLCLRPIEERSAPWRAPSPAIPIALPFPVLHSLGFELRRTPTGEPYSGTRDLAIAFFEHTVLSAETRKRSERYEMLIVGSRWNADLLAEAVRQPVAVWHQGVDLSRFRPGPKRRLFPDRFVIFSGGVLRLRKGQDIVVRAFREFQTKHQEALLITAWSSPYPRYANSMLFSSIQESPFDRGDPGKLNLDAWLEAAGIPGDAFCNLPLMPNRAFSRIYAEADVAVFPNRAEGGTNLVAMEAMACGVPCIISTGTGHRDLIERFPCYPLEFRPFQPQQRLPFGQDGWCEPSVDEVVAKLEEVHANPHQAREIGARAAELITEWSWEKQVPRLLKLIEDGPSRRGT